jgi:uncharacterized protein (TIGR02996 family)
MTDDATFLQALQADPQNNTIRLAYADWLEEHGDRRAEFLRVEAALIQQPESEPLRRRIYELRRLIDRDWQAAVDRTKIENCLFHIEFLCPKRWEALKATGQATVRFCESCKKNVYYCHSLMDARLHVVEDECVAIDSRLIRPPGPLISEPPSYYMGVLRAND